MRALLVAAIVALLPLPAAAQWRHAASGLILPDQVGDMRRGDPPAQTDRAVTLQYGTEAEPVTLYVWQPPYPNAGLWFERAVALMQAMLGPLSPAADATIGASLNAKAPNTIRQSFAVDRPGAWRSSAVAVAGHGAWLMKLRASSQTLAATALAARLDRLLAAITSETPAEPLPLQPVAPCAETRKLSTARALTGDTAAQAVVAAALTGVSVSRNASGARGLAREPARWCRMKTDHPPMLATFYRPIEGDGWVGLMGDAGPALVASEILPLAKSRARAALYSVDMGSASVRGIFKDIPSPGRVLRKDGAIVRAGTASSSSPRVDGRIRATRIR